MMKVWIKHCKILIKILLTQEEQSFWLAMAIPVVAPFEFVKYMSNRRMFSNRIANSAKFLQMPVESQLLYFHMILRADDDGVVESYPLMKLLGIASDNFKILQAKGFIRQLNEDQVIVIIDWLEHNTIRADRKVDSIYKNLLLQNAPEIKLIEPKPRSDVEDNSKRLGGQSTDGISQVKLSQVKSIDIVAKSDTPSFLLEDKLKDMEKNSGGYLDIIATFIREKELCPENSKQLSNIISRYCKIAKKLEGAYTNQQIFKAIEEVKKDSNSFSRRGDELDWTLDTVYKKLTK